ncbi:phospho-N-acetylmuramoyl-pentapeptide-transferase [Prochlorococcus sp. MIT 1341]|uniref:phospho-N-acetylmuramoyl-pentapeptide- transferase n=1 Tax=Prochlorococcus sp. MIT 1341 TaxID=3096221 RepID=UPI002A7669F6|nr:phospho-N-acetylmuramoyl-pentapeptide-transferase [Prochlorococcus sp. MIT 1341]
MKISKSLNPATISSLILGSLIFASCFISDQLIVNSFLSVPLICCTIFSILCTHLSIPQLKTLKIGQIIRPEGPQSHKRKSGTPTMGGIAVIPISLIIGSLISVNEGMGTKLIAISSITLAFMFIGGLDDLQSLLDARSLGLTAKKKILLQSIASSIFLVYCSFQNWIDPTINFPWHQSISIGLLIWPLSLFVFLAESNSTNLTDGLDGLASGCGALVFTGIAIHLMLRGNNGDPALAGFSIAMAGGWLGFLSQNHNPAKLFMGDTGSLAMGASLAAIALLSDSLWALLIMGGVFLAEALSVIIQVSIFKFTKKKYGVGYRLLKMAPLHHHLELSGLSENLIVTSFWLITCILIGIVLITTVPT